jgi:mono/diheme cytochrome c family protein
MTPVRALVGSGVVIVVITFAVAAQSPRTVWDRVYTEEQAGRGGKLYSEQCASCHGEGLTGVEAAPALAGDMFNSNWEGVALSDLFERIRTSMPQNKPGSLTRAQTADILAHMLKVGGFPAGETALDGQAGALAQTKFLTYRPQ